MNLINLPDSSTNHDPNPENTEPIFNTYIFMANLFVCVQYTILYSILLVEFIISIFIKDILPNIWKKFSIIFKLFPEVPESVP